LLYLQNLLQEGIDVLYRNCRHRRRLLHRLQHGVRQVLEQQDRWHQVGGHQGPLCAKL
ncbi:hypothetical protein IW146_010043, partial [Coemansia sp. RSA 922]